MVFKYPPPVGAGSGPAGVANTSGVPQVGPVGSAAISPKGGSAKDSIAVGTPMDGSGESCMDMDPLV